MTMKKYNLSEIMKTAWKNFRNAMGTFSKCLKAAWAQAKGVIKMMKGSEKQVAWAKSIRDTFITNFERDMEFMANGGRWLKIVGSDKKVWRNEKPDRQMLNKYKVKDNYMFLVEIKDDLIKFMNSIDDAKVFIDSRYCDSVVDFFFHNGQLFFDWWNNNNSHGVIWTDEKDFSKWWLNGGKGNQD